MNKTTKGTKPKSSRKLPKKNDVEFLLFAPYNQAVSLIGSFSDWQELPMQKGSDGYFRLRACRW